MERESLEQSVSAWAKGDAARAGVAQTIIALARMAVRLSGLIAEGDGAGRNRDEIGQQRRVHASSLGELDRGNPYDNCRGPGFFFACTHRAGRGPRGIIGLVGGMGNARGKAANPASSAGCIHGYGCV